MSGIILSIFMSPLNKVWPEVYCFCPVRSSVCVSMCASRNIIYMISCGEFDTFSLNLHRRCMGQRWMLRNLGSKGQRSRSQLNKVVLETTLSGLVNRVSWKVLVEFSPTYTNDVLWDRDECVKFWGQRVKLQGQSGITYAGTVTAQA